MLRSAFFTVALLLGVTLGAVSNANAGIVYDWVNVSNGPRVPGLDMKIVVEDAFWRRGYIDQSANGDSELFLQSESDVISFEYAGAGIYDNLLFSRCEDVQIDNGCSAHVSLDTYVLHPYSFFDFDVEKLGVGLSGSLYFGSIGSTISLESRADGLWNLNLLVSDFAEGCASYIRPCQTTGYWVVDPTSIPVPEPTPLALFVGLAAFGLALRLGGVCTGRGEG